MALVSIGDLARSLMLQRHTTTLKTDIQRLSGELVTGRHADPTRAMGGNLSPLAAIDASLSRLSGWATAGTEAGLMLGAMQTVLRHVDDTASDLSGNLLAAVGTGDDRLLSTTLADGAERFATVVAGLNTRFADRTLFAGNATDGPAIAAPETILAALTAATATATTAAEFRQAVDQWFDDPAGFAAAAYLGGAQGLGPIPVAAGESVTIPVTAAAQELRDTLKPLAMTALLARGAFSSDATARADLARQAGEALVSGAAGRATLAAGLGLLEGRLAAAETRNASEATALGIARAGMVSADPFAAAAELETAQTRLETLYAVTARLSRLSLADYLR